MNTIVVDLDETLIKTDLLYELFFIFLKGSPLNLFKMLYWLGSGGALRLKLELAKRVQPDVGSLPYRTEIIELLKVKKRSNFKLVLASAGPHVWVQKVADHLGFFDHFIGSQDENLKGINKYEKIKDLLGIEKFIYVGDSSSDVDIWCKCGEAITVNVDKQRIQKIKGKATILQSIDDRQSFPFAMIAKQLRIHQWSKNAILFLPMVAAHTLQLDYLLNVGIAFMSFGFAASAIYILNDLVDIESDRSHHSKRNRPLAAGKLRIKYAIFLFLGLVFVALAAAFFVNESFVAVVLGYWGMNVLYTFFLKREVILDIILLSGMYTIRLFAGSEAVQVPLSQWLLSFSTLFFFSLACVKRYTELLRVERSASVKGRGYISVDGMVIFSLGIGAGVLSILVFLLYLQSPEINRLYSKIERLWVLTPLLLYWLGRIWLLAGRNEVNDDPVVFAIKDRVSWGCFVGILVIMVSAV